jgi:hypothetical protein
MRIPLLPVAATLALLAGPALAIDTPTQDGSAGDHSATNAGTPSQQHAGQNTAALEEHLRQSLKHAGFSEIQIMPAAFIVRAKGQDGTMVTMMIQPDEIEGVTVAPPGSQDKEQDGTGLIDPSQQGRIQD